MQFNLALYQLNFNTVRFHNLAGDGYLLLCSLYGRLLQVIHNLGKASTMLSHRTHNMWLAMDWFSPSLAWDGF
jgi:hypothetical protein